MRVVTKHNRLTLHTGDWWVLWHGDDIPSGWELLYWGASCYTLSAADEVATIGNALQIPLNMCQTEFLVSGIINKALANGVTVFARSVFAQGYLLNIGMGVAACINFVRNAAPDVIPVIGCELPEQVIEIAEVFK